MGQTLCAPAVTPIVNLLHLQVSHYFFNFFLNTTNVRHEKDNLHTIVLLFIKVVISNV